MIDIHTHLLPGVDDGSPSIEASLPVLRAFAQGGVDTVVCTPHLTASRTAVAPFDRHQRLLEELVAASGQAPRLLLGWEIMLDQPGADLRDPRLCLGRSSAVLVEFPHTAIPPNAAAELYRLRMSGVVPVVAHVERYGGCTPDVVDDWRRAGAAIQVNVTSLARGPRARLVGDLLASGLVDVLASDTHCDARSLVSARDWLLEFATLEHADLLTRENARRLLSNEPVEAVPPLTIERGILSRLRDLIRPRSAPQ